MQSKKNNQQKYKSAIIRIQKHWKGAIARKKYKKILKKHKKKMYTINQLVDTQKIYVESLQFVVKQVLQPARQVIDAQMYSYLCSNIIQILIMHQNFLTNLKKAMQKFNSTTSKISQVLLNDLFSKQQFKHAYTNYCYSYKGIDQVIKILISNNQSFCNIIKKAGLGNNLNLEFYMIKPVQRICKYGIMVEQYLKNMELYHPDYKDIETTYDLIQKLVRQTNQQVQQFLMKERMCQIQRFFPTFFNKLNKKLKLYYESKDVNYLDIVRQSSSSFKSLALCSGIAILIPKISEQPFLINFDYYRDLNNLKYFKNIVQLAHQKSYTYIQFKEQKQKKQFITALNSLPDFQKSKGVRVSVLGTETRQSFFSSYTVYIVHISVEGAQSTIYPRFKDLIRVQQIMADKGIKFEPPLLSKQLSIHSLKSKTIQKRRILIQEFLERVCNNSQSSLQQVQQILGIGIGNSFQRKSGQVQQVTVLLPNMQKIKVFIAIHEAKVRDLKHAISQQLGMQSFNQFQIFQVRNKEYQHRKLLYDQQPVKRIYQQQIQAQSSLNPFRVCIQYLFTRHYYLEQAEEDMLYRMDPARAQLEVSVIHFQLQNYRLDQQVMLTFICLFALYISLPVNDPDKLSFFIKQITKKQYKIAQQQFKIYYSQVRNMVLSQDPTSQSLPLMLIRVISNSYLYQCQQFQVQVHHKVYSQLKKIFPTLQQKIVFILNPNQVYLLTIKDRKNITKFSYSQLAIKQTHPNAVVYEMLYSQVPLTLKSLQSFQITKIFDIYKQISNKN